MGATGRATCRKGHGRRRWRLLRRRWGRCRRRLASSYWVGRRRGFTGSIEDWSQVRFDDALVGGDEPEAVNASGGDDDAIHRVAQGWAEGCDFGCDFEGEGEDLENGVPLDPFEQCFRGSF